MGRVEGKGKVDGGAKDGDTGMDEWCCRVGCVCRSTKRRAMLERSRNPIGSQPIARPSQRRPALDPVICLLVLCGTILHIRTISFRDRTDAASFLSIPLPSFPAVQSMYGALIAPCPPNYPRRSSLDNNRLSRYAAGRRHLYAVHTAVSPFTPLTQ